MAEEAMPDRVVGDDGSTSGGTGGFDPFAGPVIVRTAPTTEAQREIWTATRLSDAASLCYNESITLRLTGPVDLAALGTAFADLIDRHDALRSTISGDGLTMLVGETPLAPVDVVDLSDLTVSEQNARFDALLDREVETPFDLENGPLFRTHLVRLADDHVRAVLTAHHIVFDGWSTAVLIEEWATLYRARLVGTGLGADPAGPELDPPSSFCDYSLAEADYRDSDGYRVDEEYWLQRFAEPQLPTLDLPSDRPRPRVRSFEARRHDLTLDADLVAAVRKAGAKRGASLFTTLLAGFDALLYRLSNQDDLVVGIPAAGQSVGGWNNLVGHCVNILPIRSSLDAELPFADLVEATRGTMLDAQDHQRMTFGSLLAQLPIQRDPSRTPLVSVLFNVDRGLPSEAMDFEGLVAELETNERHFEIFDLFLNIVELPDRMVLECQYNRALFDAETVERWLAAYQRLLAAVAADPETPLGLLSLTNDADEDRIRAWNDATEAEHDLDVGIADLIDEQVAARPDAVACRFEEQRLTYAELDARAERLAESLRRAGTGPGDLVGLSVERSERLLIGLLGILKSGAGYVPLDPGFPAERLHYMVADSGIAGLVTEHGTHEELGLSASTVIFVEDVTADTAVTDNTGEPVPVDPVRERRGNRGTDTAYVIYTSGSTGQPKGVVVPHRSVVNLFHSMRREPGMSEGDTVLAVTTLSFDISVVELLLPLAVGAEVVVASRETASDGARLLDLLASSGATYIQATPATYRLLFAAGFEGDPDLKVVCGGEALPMELGQRLADCVGSLWNAYGPTETTVWSSFHRIRPGDDRVLIGRPADNTRFHVLDDRLQPVPIGVPGELYIAGDGLSDGYFGQPDMTSARFVDDPFRNDDSLMYRTGDLGRYLPDGRLECLGRNDFQVKVRGYRIELGEIEHVLDQHPAVAQSVVVAREDTPGDVRLVGYLRPEPTDGSAEPAVDGNDGAPDDAELRSHLRRSLPDYMVPGVYVRLDRIPLTPNGKVDRNALPAPDPSTTRSAGALIEPRTDSERLVATLFQDSLSVPRVSVDDDFFAMGGHSLLASQILGRLRQDHGVALSFRTIFEAPTVERLAAVIDDAAGTDGAVGAERPAITHTIDLGDVPLSVSQERLWLLEEMDPTQRLVHNLPAAWRLDGPVDVELLQRSIDEIARRHGTLRTRLVRVDNSVVQRIEPEVELPIEVVDLRSVPADEREAALHDRMSERTREPFDLYRLPLFRSHLFLLDDNRSVFHTVRHNLIWDGWSFDVFLRELTTLYTAFESNDPALTDPSASPLPELPISYADYIGYQRDHIQSPEMAKQIDFWRERLAGDPPEATLPSDRPRPRTSQHTGENLVVHLGRETADALTALGREHGATLYMVLLAGFKAMLHRYSGQRDLLVGTPVRARQLPEVEGLIGPFINAVVLRTEVAPESSFVELLDQVREVTLDSFSNEDMPLEVLGTRPPVVRTFFSFQDARERPASLGSVSVEQLHAEPPAAANDLMLWMMETPTDLLAVANFSVELFDEATISGFLDGYRTLLGAALADPHASVRSLPVSADGGAGALRHGESHGETVDDPGAAWLDNARRRPDAAAIRAGDRTVDHGDLLAATVAAATALETADGKLVGVHAPSLRDRLAASLACLVTGRPFTTLASGGPADFVSRQLTERACDLVLAADDSDLPDDVAVVRFGTEADAAAPGTGTGTGVGVGTEVGDLSTADESGSAAAHLTAAGRWTSRAGLASAAASLADALDLDVDRQLAWVLPSGSEPELLLAMAALGRGAAVTALSPRDRLDRCGLDRIDVLVAAPDALGRYGDAELDLVGTVVVIGEPGPGLVERIRTGGRRLLRLHVSDEAGLGAFLGEIDEPGIGTCIGRPLYPLVAAVIDAGSGPCGEGIEGDVFVATRAPVGPAPDPVRWDDTPDRFVATGDVGRVRTDGRFELRRGASGRIDSMGVRFDASSVERSLEGHAAIEQAHVVSSRARSGDSRLVAYIHTAAGEASTATELRRFLRDRVPEEMVPQVFTEVDEWPLDANGDVALERLARRGGDDDTPFVAPASESERLLAALWQDDLGVARVGVHDNFFDLGGHSLLCFKVLGRLEEQTGVLLSPRVMLLGSLEQAAVELDTARDSAASPSPTAPVGEADPQADESQGRGGRLMRRLKKAGGGS